MDKVLPRRLGAEPVVDAICEIRFEKASFDIVGLLPGLLMDRLGPVDEVLKLPAGHVPAGIEIGDLAEQPHVRVRVGRVFVSVGPRVLAVAMPDPYPGWAVFREAALNVFNLSREKKLVELVSRVSVRYTDLIQTGQFDQLRAKLSLGGVSTFDAVEIRADRKVDGVRVINTIASPASLGDGRSGLVVDTDTIIEGPDDFWNRAAEHLDRLHTVSKEVFFSMINEDTLNSLRPEYD